MDLDSLKWDDKGLISVVFQDHETGEVLTLGYMNREALKVTFDTGKAHVFRRSHGKVMMKGETSGNVQLVKEILVDCDADALVMKIETLGERVFDPKEVYGT